MCTIKINEHAFYKITWYFGRSRHLVKFNGSTIDNNNAIYKWLEYGKT